MLLALDISGESVDAIWDTWITSHISQEDFSGNLQSLLRTLRQKFREDKKRCGDPKYGPGSPSSYWKVSAPGLRINKKKGFEKDYIKFPR